MWIVCRTLLPIINWKSLLSCLILTSLLIGTISATPDESSTGTAFDGDTFTLSPILSSTSVSSSVHEHVSSVVSSSSSSSSEHDVHDDDKTKGTVDVIWQLGPPVDPVIIERETLSFIPSTTPTTTTTEPPGPILPTAEIYLAGVNDELTLLTNASNSEVLIDKNHVFNASEFINIVLVCTSTYPIQWIYEGDGAPTRMYSSELRTYEDFLNASSYEYFTTLVLMQERNNEHLTGKYTCQGSEYPNNGEVYYHLYFPGGYGFPTIRNRVIRPPKNDSHVNLPCKATNPNLPMTLYKIFPKEEAGNLTSHFAVNYDPKDGFKMDLNAFDHPYGTYYCSLNELDSFWKIDIVPRQEDEVIATPNEYVVSQENFSNQTFQCEAKENFEFIFPQTLEYGIVSYFKNSSSEFPFVGVYELNHNLPINTLSRYFKIQCVTKRTRRILHTWEYTSIGAEQLSIKYDSKQRRILCCSRSGLSTVQEVVKCETKTDCEIKKKCFENGRCEYPFPPKFNDGPPGCVAMEFLERVPTHVVKCAVGQTSKLMTVTETIDKNSVYISDGASVPSTNLILRILLLSQSSTNDIKVKCSGNLYYFSSNFVFGLERADGSIEYLNRELIDTSDPYEPVLFTRIRKNVRNIHCFAPLSGSSEWRNVTLPVIATEPTTTTSTTTARSLARGSSVFRGRTRLAALSG